MAGKQSQLTSLKIRKQLLSLESEFNRAQLFNECRDFKNEIHLLKKQMESDLSFFASGAKVAMSLAVIDTAFTDRDRGKKDKSSWISTLLNGVRMGTLLWAALRPHLK